MPILPTPSRRDSPLNPVISTCSDYGTLIAQKRRPGPPKLEIRSCHEAAMKAFDRTGPTEGSQAAPEVCRFLEDPAPDCYCTSLTSRKISKIVAYCADDYRACPIYRSKLGRSH